LLGLLKKLLVKRAKDFKLLIMSATLEMEKFKSYFEQSVFLKILGRTHPIDLHYLISPISDYIFGIMNKVLSIHFKEEQGDILVFLTG